LNFRQSTQPPILTVKAGETKWQTDKNVFVLILCIISNLGKNPQVANSVNKGAQRRGVALCGGLRRLLYFLAGHAVA
jgi:hypothetical protein